MDFATTDGGLNVKRQCFDKNWLFDRGDKFGVRWSKKPDTANFQKVHLPHDWTIELSPQPDAPGGPFVGYFPGGVGWYAKTFVVPGDLAGSSVFIEFEGVYMNSETWVNGNYLGRHPYGYTTYCYDLTPYVKFGEENQILVCVDNSHQPNSRWYSGSGIYRHVWLMVAPSLHIGHWGTYVTTNQVSDGQALLTVQTTVQNDGDNPREVMVRSSVVDPDGSVVATSESPTSVEARASQDISQEVQVANPMLWAVESPSLYTLQSEIVADGEVVDSSETSFGIRTISFDASQGFKLNGKSMKLKGGCVHHDNGILGAASYDRAEERKVELLKASGFNAVRCAHNPPAPAFLDACDRLGMLVIDEAFDCWREGKNNGDYHVSFDDWWQRDLSGMVRRDRNHPSVILWSIGNEVLERDGRSEGAHTARQLADHVRDLDPTRPITAGVNGGDNQWPWEKTDAIISAIDVPGYNYQITQYRFDHKRCPTRVIYGSETTPQQSLEVWTDAINDDHVIGDFVWTSLDYLGEAGIGRVHFGESEKAFLGAYPWNQANCGDIDVCGFKRPQSYYRDILWGRERLYIVAHVPTPEGRTPVTTYWGWPDVVPSWTWPGHEEELFKVDVYSSCEEVALFLNDQFLGTQPSTQKEKFTATFEVPYEPGTIKAVGYINGRAVEERVLKTASEPVGIRLTADRTKLKAEYGDLSYVAVKLVDQNGTVCAASDRNIYFTVNGEAEIAAVGSSNPASSERYRGNQRKTYRGRCLVVVRASGEPGRAWLRAQADGVNTAEICIEMK